MENLQEFIKNKDITVCLDRDHYSLEDADFDKYGFALLSDVFTGEFFKLQREIVFFTRDTNNVAYIDNHYGVKNLKKVNCVSISIPHDIYEAHLDEIRGKDIVSTFCALIRFSKKSDVARIFNEVPTCLFENRDVMYEIMKELPKDGAVIHECRNVLKEKHEIISFANAEKMREAIEYEALAEDIANPGLAFGKMMREIDEYTAKK